MKNSLLTLALVVLPLGVILMEFFAGIGHTDNLSQRDRSGNIHDSPKSQAAT